MKFINQKLPGVVRIEPEPFTDPRGSFSRHFCKKEFEQNGISMDIKQCNIAENVRALTLRGFHYLIEPHKEGKIISCLRGGIYVVVVDLRISSPTYALWTSALLKEENGASLYVPPGCANAYLTLVSRTCVLYYHSDFYAADAERGIRYNDPFFNFEWPADPLVISAKDAMYTDFENRKLHA